MNRLEKYPELDEQAAAYIEKQKQAKPATPEDLTEAEKVARQREGFKKVIPAGGEPEGLFNIIEQKISLPDRELPLKIYYPSDKKDLPALLYFHGGGFIAGGFDTHEQMMHYLANHAGVVVISVGYRLAPENQYPAAVNDAYDAMQWVQEHAPSIKIDPQRIAIGGDSAGGALAVAAMLKAKAAGTTLPVFQLLFDPTLDLTMNTPSWAELGHKVYILNADTSKQYYDWYLPAGTNRTDPLVSPVFAKDFNGFPPAFIITGSADPQKDEAKVYAENLSYVVGKVDHKTYDGAMHGFYQMSAIFDKGKLALQDAATALRKAMGD